MHSEFFDLLRSEHNVIKGLLSRATSSSSSDKSERESILKELRKNLIPHMRGEENAFYPILIDNRETKNLGLIAVEEHNAARSILNEIEKLDPSDDRWLAKFHVFSSLIHAHIQMEESKIFDAVRLTFDDSQLGSVLKNYEDVETRTKAGVV